MHLATEADGIDFPFRQLRETRLDSFPPEFWILFRPTRLGHRNPVFSVGLAQNLSGLIDDDGFASRSSDINPEEFAHAPILTPHAQSPVPEGYRG